MIPPMSIPTRDPSVFLELRLLEDGVTVRPVAVVLGGGLSRAGAYPQAVARARAALEGEPLEVSHVEVHLERYEWWSLYRAEMRRRERAQRRVRKGLA